ncbi:lanthionine synthetase C family protein [uncultured Chitinophaga sp.]|jgi:Lantibiotic modifying enzyme|uniref:lanthionine synthetase C family protein n=1 Tax=uncultured Chitinophaga sp. TaxID=339340 RepID=UPI002631E060|nr:lanthionine synthetase C family protein [uncultured Chitinophaga sp.]
MSYSLPINKKLEEINSTLNYFMSREKDPGLLSGYSGCALFYAYYYRLSGKQQHLRRLQQVLQKMTHALSEQALTASHCSGVAGIAWCLQHLTNEGFIEQGEIDDAFGETDEILLQYLQGELEQQHYDFLHQGLGAALYFLDRPMNAAVMAALEALVTALEKAAIVLETGVSWKDQFVRKDNTEDHYNLGLAHGVPAILAVLGMLYEKRIFAERALPLLQKGMQWLLSTRNEPAANANSWFPTMVTRNNVAIGSPQSRLGWCYGDLGIAITLWNTGVRLEKAAWKKEAVDILAYTLSQRDSQNGLVRDAGLCHGSMGIAHIYRRVYTASGDDRLQEGADRWLDQTFELGAWKDGPAGFKAHTLNGYINTFNLLEGVTGIGLALMAALDEKAAAWDRCLLLS